MAYTKRDIIDGAFGDLTLAGYIFDISPEELQQALNLLDTMMASWDIRGIRLGYALPGDPNGSDIDDYSGLPDWSIMAVRSNLALLISNTQGKQVSPALAATASNTFKLLPRCIPKMQLGHQLPVGSGNRQYLYREQFFTPVCRDDTE